MESILYTVLSEFIIVAIIALTAAIPAALVVVGYKKNVYWLAGVSVAVSAITMPFIGLVGGLSVLLLVLPLSYMIMYCMQQKTGLLKAVAAGLCVLLVMSVAVYFIWNRATGFDITEEIDRFAEQLAPYMQEYLVLLDETVDETTSVELTRQYMLLTLPSVVFITGTLISLLTYSFSASFMNRKLAKSKKIRYVPFEMWQIPTNVGCFLWVSLLIVLFLSNIFEWAEAILTLVLVFYFFTVGIQGASFAIFFQKKYKMPTVAAWIILIIVMAVSPFIIILLGVVDQVFRIKLSYLIKHGLIKVKTVKRPNIFNGKIMGINDDDAKIINDLKDDETNNSDVNPDNPDDSDEEDDGSDGNDDDDNSSDDGNSDDNNEN